MQNKKMQDKKMQDVQKVPSAKADGNILYFIPRD
jgi:hypothetical protein